MKFQAFIGCSLAISTASGFITSLPHPSTYVLTKKDGEKTRRHNGLLNLTTITSSTTSTTNEDGSPLLPSSVYSTIQEGKIAVVRNFLPQHEINLLRSDAQSLWDEQKFSIDALAGYGSSGKFDPTKDRAVLRLQQWKDMSIGNYENRQRFGNLMSNIRSQLSVNLNRPGLNQGLATTKYGYGSTEISYTRFGSGAFLKRHVDEHHEELKGVDGWSKPTRRSISWLIYLNDQDWDGRKYGGQLRCFERKDRPVGDGITTSFSDYGRIGATANGDLQIGWLRASAFDPVERPVYLDAKKHNHGDCAMYVVNDNNSISTNTRSYISKNFQTQPIMYVAGSEALVKKTLFGDRKDIADRFHLIEPPKSKISDILKGDKAYAGWGEDGAADEMLEDIDPRGGTLVMFDSVSLPHEVLATKDRTRWACSGWFHEDQQPAPV